MRKKYLTLAVFLLLFTGMTGCSREKAFTQTAAQHEQEARAYTVTGNPNQDLSSADKQAVHTNKQYEQGSTRIELEGKVIMQGNNIKIIGTSNLQPGAIVKANLAVKNSLLTSYTDEAEVQKDGSYELTVTRPQLKGAMDMTVFFRPTSQNQTIRNTYGDHGEKLSGPFIYKYKEGHDIFHEARIGAHIDPNQNKNIPLVQPVWNKPEDYGSPKVWIKPEVTQQGNYYNVYARSNLLEGSDIKLTIDIPGRWQFGYDDATQVLPDGSFSLRVKKPSMAQNYAIVLRFEPNEDMWPTAAELYGSNGAKLQGPLVTIVHNSEDSRIIEARVQIHP